MVLKIFICPSHIANWSLGLLESMGHNRHPIRALGSFHYQQDICICHLIWKWTTQKTKFRHSSCIGVYGKYLQVDRRKIKRWSIHWGMHPSIGNTWVPVKIRYIADYWKGYSMLDWCCSFNGDIVTSCRCAQLLILGHSRVNICTRGGF